MTTTPVPLNQQINPTAPNNATPRAKSSSPPPPNTGPKYVLPTPPAANDTNQPFDPTRFTPVSDADAPSPFNTGEDNDQSSLGSQVKSFWNAATTAFTSSALLPLQGYFDKTNADGQKIVQQQLASGHPYRAAIAKTYLTVQKDVEDLLSGALTPGNVALAAEPEFAGAKLAPYISKLKFASNLYFTFRGSQDYVQGQQANESVGDVWNRRFMAGTQIVMSTLGAAQQLKDHFHDKLQTNLGISGSLADTVTNKVMESQAVQDYSDKMEAQRVAATKGQVDSTKQIASGIINRIEGEGNTGATSRINATDQTTGETIVDPVTGETTKVGGEFPAELPVRMGFVMGLAGQEIAKREAYFDNQFASFNHDADGNPRVVTDADSLRAMIVNKVTGYNGVMASEIPTSVFNAIPRSLEPGDIRPLDANEQLGSLMVRDLARKGVDSDDIRLELINRNFTPSQADLIMDAGGVKQEGKPITFKAMTRVRNDLYRAAQASDARDTDVAGALRSSMKDVTAMQEQHAEDAGFGDKYTKVKDEYAEHKSELGSGVMKDFMYAKEIQDQNMNGHLTQLFDKGNAETLGKLFRSAGVDVSPIADLMKERDDVAQGASNRVNEIQDDAQQWIKDNGIRTEDEIKAIGNRNPIVKGESDFQFAGKSTEQIRRDAMQKLANNMKQAGITNPSAYIQVTMGLSRTFFGSVLGAAQAAQGASHIMITKMLKSPAFQDWMADESGVSGATRDKFGESVGSSYNKLRDLFQSALPSGVLNNYINKIRESQQQDADKQQAAPSNLPVPTPTAPAPPTTPAPAKSNVPGLNVANGKNPNPPKPAGRTGGIRITP